MKISLLKNTYFYDYKIKSYNLKMSFKLVKYTDIKIVEFSTFL